MLNFKRSVRRSVWLLLLFTTVGGLVAQENKMVELPQPVMDGKQSLPQLLQQRRSQREYSRESLSLAEVSQLLWAAQGITGEDGFKRAAPSAGARIGVPVPATMSTPWWNSRSPVNGSLRQP